VIPQGSFMMGRSASGSDAYASGHANELPAHSVTVSSFKLDKYEVTVGRFRQFVTAYSAGWRPSAGAGAHPTISGSGWNVAWDDSARIGTNLPLTGADAATTKAIFATRLKCGSSYQTWTDISGLNEAMPINCVDWFEAMAFCIWDGGRLPTEAEWEYAAVGGSEERLYPWGSALPSVETTKANSSLSDKSPYIAVGSHPTGAGKWGQQDLAGSMWEWNLDWYGDWYSNPSASGADVCYLTTSFSRVMRGGSWSLNNIDDFLRAAKRHIVAPSTHYYGSGLRCSRTP